jgi:hypothetical protein
MSPQSGPLRVRTMLSLVLPALVPGLLVLACSGEPEHPSSPPPPAAPPRAAEPSDFYTVAPCRILDTRTDATPLEDGPERTFPIAGKGCHIPASAVAVAANVTVVGKEGRGVVLLRPDAGRGWLELRFEQGVNRSTHVLLSLSPDGSVTATARDGTAHVLVDVSGYFLPARTPEPPAGSPAAPG